MTYTPLISLIVPAYNASEFLSDCLTSIRQQTHTNLEIIVIDNNSTDDTVSIAKQHAKEDPRIILLHESTRGPSAARNSGLNHAQGTYVSFVDADDLLHPDSIKLLLTICEASGADIALHQFQRIPHSTSLTDLPRFESIKHFKYTLLNSTEATKRLLYSEGIPSGSLAKLIRRCLIEENRIRFLEKVHYAEDVALNTQLLMRSSKVAISQFKGHYYRIHTGSQMISPFTHNRFSALKAFSKLQSYLENESPSLKAAITARHFIEAIHIIEFMGSDLEKCQTEVKQCMDIISRYRRQVFFNPRSHWNRERYFVLSSLLGPKMISKAATIKTKIWTSLRGV